MTENRERFLERTKHEFLEDLTRSFGDRSEAFSEDLKVLLFEMWTRARSRPSFPQHKPEPTEVMKSAEFEVRLMTVLEDIRASTADPTLRSQFARAVASTIATGPGITRFDSDRGVRLENNVAGMVDQYQFAQALDDCLDLGPGLEKTLDQGLGQLKLQASTQNALPEWVPVYQHQATGVRAGINLELHQQHRHEPVDTLLVHDGVNWLFPTPKPEYNGGLPEVTVTVDGILQLDTSLLWQSSYCTVRCTEVVDSVSLTTIPLSNATVRATYTSLVTEPLL